MNRIRYTRDYESILADVITPVSVYLSLRDLYPKSILLESSDHTQKEGNLSIIGLDPLVSFTVADGQIQILHKDLVKESYSVDSEERVTERLKQFLDSFVLDDGPPLPFSIDGLYGFTSYDAVRFFEEVSLADRPKTTPDILYSFYRILIIFDHFKHQVYIVHNRIYQDATDAIREVKDLLTHRDISQYPFKTEEAFTSNMSDAEFINRVVKGKAHCARGDVFQVVLSRSFQQKFTGDDFNVYRALRRINPSPYMFYFDHGNYRLIGSSPEAQIIIEQNKATITPIAGTYKRTGDNQKDREAAKKLLQDPKENAEHTMLVDLARNDLSRQSNHVEVEKLQEIQMYSHVIHIVSHVSGTLNGHALDMYAETFPAGTLSGAPKIRAMQIIDENEPTARGFYGGAIGYLGFNGDIVHAIIIRSALSKNNILHYQAGAGVVMHSDPEKECQEVYHKVGAVQQAIQDAQKIIAS